MVLDKMAVVESQYLQDEIELLAKLVEQRTGIRFDSKRRRDLVRSIGVASGAVASPSLSEYYRQLEATDTNSELWDRLVAEITVGETYFMRNAKHVAILRNHILPDLIQKKAQDRQLRIWSAGCSTGEEPYTLAILLDQLLPDAAKWHISILATDINRKALQVAQIGVYRHWSLRNTPKSVMEAYFRPSSPLKPGGKQPSYELVSRIRDKVSFAYLNLAENCYPSLETNTNGLDLIVHRNVAIYLPNEVNRQIGARFYRCLVSDGWLMVGAVECNNETYAQYRTRSFLQTTIYQKSSEAADAQSDPRLASTRLLRKPARKRRRPEPAKLAPRPVGGQPKPLSSSEGVKLTDGIELMKRGNYSEAAACFLAHVEQAPQDYRGYYQLSRLCANQGKLDEALQWGEKAIEIDPLVPEAQYTLALVYLEQDQMDQAEQQLKKALYLKPDFVLAHFSLFNLYRQTGAVKKTLRHQKQILALVAPLEKDELIWAADDLTVGQLQAMATSFGAEATRHG